MRISLDERRGVATPVPSNASNRTFFERAFGLAGRGSAVASIVLVGGTDAASLAVRQVQAAIRLDRRPSPWSHAAIIVSWNRGHIEKSMGLEVALDPSDRRAQVAETNGVTEFRLERYLDENDYPNVGVMFTKITREGSERLAQMSQAIANPNLDRLRYPFWDLLGEWVSLPYRPPGRGDCAKLRRPVDSNGRCLPL
jgi:hypothetical protein